MCSSTLLNSGADLALHVRGHGSGACTASAVTISGRVAVGRIKVEQQLENLVAISLRRCSHGSVVDCNDDLMTELQRLLQHEAVCRHRTFCCVNQQNNAVYHLEDNVAGEVGGWGIDDVDLYALVMYRGVPLPEW